VKKNIVLPEMLTYAGENTSFLTYGFLWLSLVSRDRPI